MGLPIEGKHKMKEIVAPRRTTSSGRCYVPEHLNRENLGREQNPRKNVTDAEVTNFWKKMPAKEYSVKEHIKKNPHKNIHYGSINEF